MRLPKGLIRLLGLCLLSVHLWAAGIVHAGAQLQTALIASERPLSTAVLPTGMSWSDICGVGAGQEDHGATAPVCPFCVLHAAALLVATEPVLPVRLSHRTEQARIVANLPHAVFSGATPPIRAPPFIS
ncbi:hypothetical protein [Celeribacter sp.]|uniref:hypothetical protein n=1 Tax=Celeribacter sp. TaxID=1890673 RepID=UPI003A8D763C